jgi:hypothetical protein
MLGTRHSVLRSAAKAATVWTRRPYASLPLLLVALATGHASAQSERAEPRVLSPVLAAGIWSVGQLVPSPLLVVGNGGLGGGMRWQITPLIFSFGVVERPLRAFVVSPIARAAGAVELFVSPEWACCAARGRTSWLGRAGLRLYWPLRGRGDALSASIAGSAYATPAGEFGGAFELGLYTLSSILGVSLTLSPALSDRELIAALTIRYY